MRIYSSFTFFETILVIVLISILTIFINFRIFNNNLDLAADVLIKNLYLTKLFALREDKYQAFPLKFTKIEQNRTKYWFKQWWHLKITNAANDIIVYIFSDSPQKSKTTTFDTKIVRAYQYKIELARNPLNGKYLIGANREDTGNKNYPYKIETDMKLNLTKSYGIKHIETNIEYYSSSMPNKLGKRINILFDNFGNIFLSEGKKGDKGDINPLDNIRHLATKNFYIRLCLDNPCILDRCIQINITPLGYFFKSLCK